MTAAVLLGLTVRWTVSLNSYSGNTCFILIGEFFLNLSFCLFFEVFCFW